VTSAALPASDHAAPGGGPTSWPPERFMGRASALKLGMWIFLLSDAFSFSGLLISYGVLRAASERWWPPGEPALGINFTAGLTFLLICSSVTMVMAVHAAGHGAAGRKRAAAYLGLTLLGGVLFLTGQYHEYFGIAGAGLVQQGLQLGQSHRATTFYVITSFHGAHVLTGVIVLAVMLGRTLWGRTPPADAIESAGLFWHFVDLVWILVFTFVYLIPEAR
jgi:cytochrome c oxidase subunit III